MTTTVAPHRSLVPLGLIAVLLLAACGAAGAPSVSPSPSPVPSSPPANVGGGGSSGDPGTGVGVDPAPVDPNPGDPAGAIIVPKPGQLNVRPVAASGLEVAIDGRRVTVKVSWTSGVEPCYVLDSVGVERRGNDIGIQLFEGTSDPNAACIEIAQFKATIVDLGELEPGTYTISAIGGDATPVTIEIS